MREKTGRRSTASRGVFGAKHDVVPERARDVAERREPQVGVHDAHQHGKAREVGRTGHLERVDGEGLAARERSLSRRRRQSERHETVEKSPHIPAHKHLPSSAGAIVVPGKSNYK